MSVHLIWIGSDLPQWAQASLERWREQAEVRLWDDAEVERAGYRSLVGFALRKGLSLRGAADLLRIRILAEHGGVYQDIDTVPLRTEPMTARPLGWIGVFPGRPTEMRVLMNGTLAFPPEHPALTVAFSIAMDQVRDGVTNDHNVAGPRTWRKVWEQEPVPLVEAYPVVTSGSMPRLFAQAKPLDLDQLRDEYPQAEALHIIYSRRHAK